MDRPHRWRRSPNTAGAGSPVSIEVVALREGPRRAMLRRCDGLVESSETGRQLKAKCPETATLRRRGGLIEIVRRQNGSSRCRARDRELDEGSGQSDEGQDLLEVEDEAPASAEGP